MRALLLAAGAGTRLRPLTATIPKCLVPIQGRPLLDYWLDLLFGGGVDRALINTHWLAEQVVTHVAGSPWAQHIDVVREEKLLGTGGTLLANRSWFGDGPFLVAHADNLTNFDLPSFIAAHSQRPSGCVMTMLAFRSDDPTSCGIVELDERQRVTAFHEKVKAPPGDLANGAVYIFERGVIDDLDGLGKPVIDLSTEVIPRYLGKIFCVKTASYHRDIGNAESLRRAQREFKPQRS
jgi:mannose-1-phosphate guanylyltransferase